jgi:hypothetical protein
LQQLGGAGAVGVVGVLAELLDAPIDGAFELDGSGRSLAVINHLVAPAQAGAQASTARAAEPWIPAFAGMTNGKTCCSITAIAPIGRST